MGGRALNKFGIHTERKTTSDHIRIQNELTPIITEMFKTEVKGVKFYHLKETHGDLDLLILNNGNLGNITKKLEDRFGNVNSNGNVYSFEYDKYQVDIIPQPTSNWDCCSDFFDYDPSGNLIGKIAHKFGLKYGFQGLVYPFRTFSGRLSTDIVISKDSRKIFEFLGFDFDRYLQGFETLEDIYEYVINSKYFNIENFLMDNLNSVDRKRNNNRVTYQGFLEYINTKDKTDVSSYKFDTKESYINLIDSKFPGSNLKYKLHNLKLEDEKNQIISEKFNGNMVMEITSLKDKELGQFIFEFKKHIEETFNLDFKEFVYTSINMKDLIGYFFQTIFKK